MQHDPTPPHDDNADDPDGGLPAGFYEQLATPLSLARTLSHHVFRHPESAFTQELSELTNLDKEFMEEMDDVRDNASLADVMRGQPEAFMWFLRLGHLLISSPMGTQLMERLRPAGETARRAPELLEFLASCLRGLEENYVAMLAGDDAEAKQYLELGGLQLDGLVARELHTLPPLPDPNAPAAPPEPPAEDDEPAAQLSFMDAQLHMMRLALTLPGLMADLMETPFGQAVGRVPVFRSRLQQRLLQRLTDAEPDTKITFTLPELALMLQSVQVCGMAMLMPDFEELLDDAVGQAGAAPPSAEETAQTRQLMGIMITGFVELMQKQFGDEPEIRQAQQAVDQLTELL